MHLTNEQWAVVSPLIPGSQRKDGRGRPRRPDRDILDGILWILKTGAQWYELPKEYPPYQTCHRRLQEWTKKKVFEKILTVLAEDMEQRGKIDLEECFIDGTFSSAKKGGVRSEKPSEARVPRSWRSETAMVFLSPVTWPLLLRMKSPWWRKRLPNDLQKHYQDALWLTGPMTPTPWTRT
jgi:transposase